MNVTTFFFKIYMVFSFCMFAVSTHAQRGSQVQDEVEDSTASFVPFVFDSDHPIFSDESEPDVLSTEARNKGRTLGQQRLIAFMQALKIFEQSLRITQPIKIDIFQSDNFSCSTFANASYNRTWRDGRDMIPDTFYPAALANQLLGTDTSVVDGNDLADIRLTLNRQLLAGLCPRKMFYGLSERPDSRSSESVDFIDLILHELLHGLGFAQRSGSASLPFIWERFLYARDEQMTIAAMTREEVNEAASKLRNVVFTGRTTQEALRSNLRRQIRLRALGERVDTSYIFREVLNSKPVRGRGVEAELVVLDLNSCDAPTSLEDKIVMLPSGCARVEFGFNGNPNRAILDAVEQGALAVITSGEIVDSGRALRQMIPIPVVSMPFSDYLTLSAAVQSIGPGSEFLLSPDRRRKAGTDDLFRPFVHTGPNLRNTQRLLHWAPTLAPKTTKRTLGRVLMEPTISDVGEEPLRRSLGLALPALIDLGWAPARCGNGHRDRYEQCDDGNVLSGDGCEQNCTLPAVCGDGVLDVQAFERCDEGSANNDITPNACRTSCRPAFCGDGTVDAGEMCDLGGFNGVGGVCSSRCRLFDVEAEESQREG